MPKAGTTAYLKINVKNNATYKDVWKTQNLYNRMK